MQKQIIVYFFLILISIMPCKADNRMQIAVKLNSGKVLKGYLISIKDSSIVLFKKKSKEAVETEINYRQIKKIIFVNNYLENSILICGITGASVGALIGLVKGGVEGSNAMDEMIYLGSLGGTFGVAADFFIGIVSDIANTKRIKINSSFNNFLKSKEMLEKNIFELDSNKKLIL